MCILHIYAQCSNRYFEVSPSEAENAELMVEDAVSRVLLTYFEEGTVDDVAIHFSSRADMKIHYCSIQIQARCSCQRFTSFPRSKQHMEQVVEKSMRPLLRELFGHVDVEDVKLNHAPWDSTLCVYS